MELGDLSLEDVASGDESEGLKIRVHKGLKVYCVCSFLGAAGGSDAMSGSESEGEGDVKGEGQQEEPEEAGNEDDKPPSPVRE